MAWPWKESSRPSRTKACFNWRPSEVLGRFVGELPQLSQPRFYLVGNGGMIRDVKAALVERGVDRKKQIRNEAFFD